MAAFGMRDSAKQADNELPFSLPEEMAGAMRLIANPAAGAIAISALGLSVASHALGFWAGAMTGAMQASQQLFAPLSGGDEAAKPGAGPTGSSLREKPALKIVATNEPSPDPDAGASGAAARVIGPRSAEPVQAPLPKSARAKATTEPDSRPAKAAVTLQPEDFHRPRTMERPAAPDDLKSISGIGPKLEKVLNDLGVWTYAQIAAWKKEEIAWVDDYLSFKGRIERDGWIEQARALSSADKKGK